MFAKLYGVDENQVLVTLGTNDEDEPEVRFHFAPPGFGVCNFAAIYPDDDEGEENAMKYFMGITEESARAQVRRAAEAMGLEL